MELDRAPLIVREDIRLLLANGHLALANKYAEGIQCSDSADLLYVLEAVVEGRGDLPSDAKPLLIELVRLGFCGHPDQAQDFPSTFLVSTVALLTQELDRILLNASTASVSERQRTAIAIARASLSLREQASYDAPPSSQQPTAHPLRLNIGCGRQRCNGWVAADLDPSTDWVLDVGSTWPLATGSADAIYMSHVLEHLERTRVVTALREARRVLVQGRFLRIVVPNAFSWLKAYVEGDEAFFDVVYAAWKVNPKTSRLDAVMSYLGGSDGAERWFSHRSCLDFDTLRRLLQSSGFKDVRLMGYERCSDPCHATPEALIDIARRTGEPDSFSLFVDAC